MTPEEKTARKDKMLNCIKQLKADIDKLEQKKEAQKNEELSNLKFCYEKFQRYYQDLFGEKVPA